jgi:pimeloyl-ACP methyl ester carboxylesterase
MPYTNNNGVKIYYEVEGQGPPLVMLNGFSGSLEDWREQGYVESLRKNNTLILIDYRPHGRSDKPHGPEDYLVDRFVGDVVAVMDDLNIRTAHYIGYSAGGSIALTCVKMVPNRVKSVILLAASPKRDTHEAVRPFLQAVAADKYAVIARMEQVGPLSNAMRNRILNNDYQALLAAIALPKPSVEADLPKMTIPFLIILGEADEMVRYQEVSQSYKALPNAKVVPLPGINHDGIFVRSDLVLPHIKEFLAQVSKQ